MAKPPAAPPSSDIEGVDRDESKIAAVTRTPDPTQQENYEKLERENVARPPNDPEITTKGNSQ